MLHSGVVNAQEFVGGGHHVDEVRLFFGTFPIHELVHRLIGRRALEDNTHHQEQRPAQGGRTAFGDPPAAQFHLSGLIGRRVDPRKSHQSLFGVEATHIADLRHKLGAERGANPKHPHDNGVLWQGCRQGVQFLSKRGQRAGGGPELGDRLLHQKFGRIGFGHDRDAPAGAGVDVPCLFRTELITMFLAPLLIFDGKSFFSQRTDTRTMWERSDKVYPLFAAICPGRACKKAVYAWEGGVKQGNQVVFEHSMDFSTLLILPVCGLQHAPRPPECTWAVSASGRGHSWPA